MLTASLSALNVCSQSADMPHRATDAEDLLHRGPGVGWNSCVLKVNVSEVTDVKVVSQFAKNLKSFQHAINHNFSEDSAKDLELCRKLLKVSTPYQEK